MDQKIPRSTLKNSLLAFGSLILLVLAYMFGLPAYAVYSAKHDLEKIGVPFSEQKFVESACKGDQGTVQLFIQAGMNINVLAASGKDDGTPKSALHCAARKGLVPMAQSLLKQGANVDIQDDEGNTPLWYVASSGVTTNDGVNHAIEMATLLIKNKADINLHGDNGNPVLKSFSSHQLELADYLIENGADVTSRNKYDSTVLIELIQRGYSQNRSGLLDRVKALVKAGVDVNAQNKRGYSALTLACSSRQYPLIETLLDQGADPNMMNNNGQTPIFSAMSDPEIFKILVKHGADLNIKINGSTLLHQAAMSNNQAAMGLLLSSGKIDVNAKGESGETALFLASNRGNSNMVQQLLVAGAEPNIPNSQLQTPLIRAVNNHAIDIARILIDWNANVNARDGTGHTALFYAKQRLEGLTNSIYVNNSRDSDGSYSKRVTILDGKIIIATADGIAASSAPNTSNAEMMRNSRTPAYRTPPPASGTSPKTAISDPMVDLLIKAGAHV